MPWVGPYIVPELMGKLEEGGAPDLFRRMEATSNSRLSAGADSCCVGGIWESRATDWP